MEKYITAPITKETAKNLMYISAERFIQRGMLHIRGCTIY